MSGLLAQAAALSAAAEGDTVWRLDATWRYAPWLTVVALVGIVALVASCYARELSPAGRAYRSALGLLRLTTIALLLVMLSELLLAGARVGRPFFAVILDQSASMGVADQPVAGGESDRDASNGPATRFDAARRALAEGLLDRLADGYDLRIYAGADRLESLTPGEDGWRTKLSELAVAEAAPSTRLGDAIEQVVRDGAPPQGVLVLSDGRVTAGRPLGAAAELARRSTAPLYFLGVGSADQPADIALEDLLAEEVVFVDDLVSFRATVRTSGPVSGPLRVTLRQEGDDRVLAERTLSASTGGGAQPVQLIYRPTEPGDYRYEVQVTAPQLGVDELNPANNQATHLLAVRDQRVRVLVAAGGPSYEFRYLKHLLERDATVELSTFLQEADLDYVSADPSAIARLPLRSAELSSYDVVMLLDPDPRLIPRSFWPALKSFVGDEGGGLALVAGQRYLPGAYRDLPEFADLYPGNLASRGVGNAISGAGYRVAPTPLGLQRSALQLADDSPATALTWSRLPVLYWHAELGELKPAAQVLATHPAATAVSGGAAPLIVSQYFGAGQVVLHAMDSTYRWRRRTGDVYFARYWVQTIRALARGRLAAGDRQQLTVDRRRYEPGEPVRLRLRSLQAGAAEQAVSAILEEASGAQRRVELAPSADARGVFEATLDRLPIGRYRVLLSEGVGPGGPASAEFEVVAPPGEMAQLAMAAAEMRAAAERSRGVYFPFAERSALAKALPPPRAASLESLPPIELWNRWWMLAAVCGCLTAEWILRKRRAML